MNVKQKLERRMEQILRSGGYSGAINHFYPGLTRVFAEEIVRSFTYQTGTFDSDDVNAALRASLDWGAEEVI